MKWRTEITLPRLGVTIDHSTPTVMLGSCFTDEVGARLKRQLFDVSINPAGTLFNPLSIADAIDDALCGREFTEGELWEVDGTWRTLRRHSRFALADRDATLRLLNDSIDTTRRRLLEARVMIVTFGSAIAHRHIASGKVVANCHKLPAEQFSVEALPVEAITARWLPLLARLHELNPALEVIFTVSPVRHIGYGLQRDRLSKSTLIVAADILAAHGAHYFPSYEIIVDDLRDYRWYAEDMVHPSAPAVDYVYTLFRQSAMSADTIDLADKWEKLTRRIAHRYSTPEAAEAARAETIAAATRLAGGNNNLLERFISLMQ